MSRRHLRDARPLADDAAALRDGQPFRRRGPVIIGIGEGRFGRLLAGSLLDDDLLLS